MENYAYTEKDKMEEQINIGKHEPMENFLKFYAKNLDHYNFVEQFFEAVADILDLV
jgi:hypothetical protein